MSGLIENLDFHLYFCIQSVAIFCFGWVYEENPASHRYVVLKKGRVFFIAISNKCGFSSLILD